MGSLYDDSELELFDGYAVELARISGTEVNFYGKNMNGCKTAIDPLYGEPAGDEPDQSSYQGPIRLPAWVQWPTITPEAGEQGFGFKFDAICVIARKEFEDNHSPFPFEADIIEMWRTPYHDYKSLGKGLFFDAVKVESDGHIHDSPSFVQFKIYLKRNTQFGAERKLPSQP